MSDLAQQILDAIGHVEQTAFDATKGPWEWQDFGNAALVHPMRISTGQFAHPLNVLKCSKEDWPPGRADREHIALNAPDVVLRRCAADREIVAELQSWKHFYIEEDSWYSCGLAIDPSFPEEGPGSGCADDGWRGTCNCGLDAKQRRILEPLARGYGIQP